MCPMRLSTAFPYLNCCGQAGTDPEPGWHAGRQGLGKISGMVDDLQASNGGLDNQLCTEL